MVFYPPLSGAPLHEILRRGERQAGRHLEFAGRALSVLHQAPEALTGLLRTRSLEGEITEVERKCDYVPMLVPTAAPTILAVIRRAQELYARLPQESPALTHGDFKAEHVWAAPQAMTLFDFDSAHQADPAVDVGRFLADLALWCDIWQHSGLAEAQERFLAGYAAAAPPERLLRARLLEALELVRSAGRRLALIDDHWVRRVDRLLNRAVALLDDVERIEAGKPRQVTATRRSPGSAAPEV